MAVPSISREELKRRLDGGGADAPVVIDVRLKYPYEHSTVMVPGAIRMGPGRVDEFALPRDRDIVLYDSDPDDLVSTSLARGLVDRGFRVLVLAGGIAEWMNAKLPTAAKPAPQSPPPAPGALKA